MFDNQDFTSWPMPLWIPVVVVAIPPLVAILLRVVA